VSDRSGVVSAQEGIRPLFAAALVQKNFERLHLRRQQQNSSKADEFFKKWSGDSSHAVQEKIQKRLMKTHSEPCDFADFIQKKQTSSRSANRLPVPVANLTRLAVD
jgi:hypothetical protein